MRPVNKAAAKILDRLVTGLKEPGDARKIDKSAGAYMAVHVDKLADNVYAVAHYYAQNGDLITDPMMEFYRDSEGNWYPIAFEMGGRGYRRALKLSDSGNSIEGYYPREYRDQCAFVTTWMRNIKEQQGV